MPLSDTPRLLTAASPDWPRGLSDLAPPPPSVYAIGSIPLLERAVAIVGTRRPDASGAAFARALAGELAEAGVVIVSGGAIGVDSEAHLGALAAGGSTIAVLATGLRRPYPAVNRSMFAQVAARGALISEHHDLKTVYRSAFLARNRLIAAIAQLVVVVQAPVQSGALSTAAHARRLGRQLLAVPHAPWQLHGGGCLALIAGGAGSCAGSADVLSRIGALEACHKPPAPVRKVAERAAPPCDLRALDEDERKVVEVLGTRSLTADELCDESALPAARVQRALLLLLLSGIIDERGSGRYACRA